MIIATGFVVNMILDKLKDVAIEEITDFVSEAVGGLNSYIFPQTNNGLWTLAGVLNNLNVKDYTIDSNEEFVVLAFNSIDDDLESKFLVHVVDNNWTYRKA